MPELPEIETICTGIRPYIEGKTIANVVIRQTKLRWPIPQNLREVLTNLVVIAVLRRAKYLLLETNSNITVLLHLGMSGSLRIVNSDYLHTKHDHVDFIFTDGNILRYNDIRKFGYILYSSKPIQQHRLIKVLGPEPLSASFSDRYLYSHAKNKKTSIKAFIMDSHNIAGIGNIYANESLFMAGIHPARLAGDISLKHCKELVRCIKIVLNLAITQGGTSIQNFINAHGEPGYFQQSLAVYGRANKDCVHCATTIKQQKIAQRSSYFCPQCQSL